jgi:hypothetical protein
VIPELPEIISGFASCYPKFPNKIRVSGSGIPGSGFGLRVFCPALDSPVTHCIVRCDLLTISNLTPSPVDRWSRPLAVGRLAHRTVWCTLESPMNYSCDTLIFPQKQPVRQGRQSGHRTVSGAHRTVRCTACWCMFGWA